MENWKIFLNKLPEDVSEKILKFVFEENVKKAEKDLISEFIVMFRKQFFNTILNC